MFAWEDGRVLRLYRSGRDASEAERQARLLEAVRSGGVRVPEVYGLETVDGRPGIVMERLDGMDLLTALGKQPWRLFSIASTCGRAHAALNAVAAAPGMEGAQVRLARPILNPDRVPARYAEAAIARLGELTEGDRLYHGDFHPGNLMVHHGEPVVIDWSNAATGPPEADFARSRLLLRLGEPPPGAPVVVRALAGALGRLFGALYARAYRRSLKLDDALLKRWELPMAVARLGEGIEVERPRVIARIESLLASA